MAEKILRVKAEALKVNDVMQWLGPDNIPVRGAIHQIEEGLNDTFTVRLLPIGSASRTLLLGERVDVVTNE